MRWARPRRPPSRSKIEALGYGALWLPEAVGRDPFVTIAFLGAHTTKLGFATGIANLYARDADDDERAAPHDSAS